MFAAGAGAAENINSQTAEMIRYPAFALMNSVTDTEELMKFTYYEEAYEQYIELNKILNSIQLDRTCHTDLLTLLIAPRYKRLTWVVSWKKLKKRCRTILTKENKKRELVEQSMADANDRLTHLNIDYEKYKDKPQIDYGSIEGGYECYDTDFDDDDGKSGEEDVQKTKTKSANNNASKINDNQQLNSDVKPYLKVENLDSTTSNILNIIESTHLSKPVYLNKPIYFVRSTLPNPSTETAISLESRLANKTLSGTIPSQSIIEETLVADTIEQNYHLCTNTDTPIKIQENTKIKDMCISQLKSNSGFSTSSSKADIKFNIPASIRQQLEQPTMFFKSDVDSNSNSNQSRANLKHSPQTEPLNLNTSKGNIYNQARAKQEGIILNDSKRYSPTLFEDMPDDLKMAKSSIDVPYESNTSHIKVPCNTANAFNTDKPHKVICQSNSPTKPGDNALKQNLKQEQGDPEYIQSIKEITSNETSMNHPSILPLAINKEKTTADNSTSLKSIRIIPNSKKTSALRINPTAAVVFSSEAASYHRTPFLNATRNEPNILHQLLGKEIKPFSGMDAIFEDTLAPNYDLEVNRCGPDTPDEHVCSIADSTHPNTTLNDQHLSTQSLLLDEHPTAELIEKQYSVESTSCENKEKKSHEAVINQRLLNDQSVADQNQVRPTFDNSEEPSAAVDDQLLWTAPPNGELLKTNVIKLDSSRNSFNLLDQEESSEEFNFKIPAAVAKPCFFMRSKRTNVKINAPDWVQNIMFNNKTAEIIQPDKAIQNSLTTSASIKSLNNLASEEAFSENVDDDINNKPKCDNASNLSSQIHPGDVLHDNHIVFNEKLLDPHLKTYKKTKASAKLGDHKNCEKSSEKYELFAEPSEKSNQDQYSGVSPESTKEELLNSTPQEPLSLVKNQFTSSLPPTSQEPNSVCIKESVQSPPAKKRRYKPAIPSTKRRDQMIEWMDMVISANRDEHSEIEDTSGALLNLFSAQLMNTAKRIHFNYEYLKEKENLVRRSNEKGIDCEASILMASPGASVDGVKLIKAFRKNAVHNGVDFSSHEVSFTSSLAKEVLGTVIKVTLNESEAHTSCNNDHFDASDAFDEFINSRRNAKSPTLYSPTLSMKHLKNGTLAESVEYTDTSFDNLMPKKGRKRISTNVNSETITTKKKRNTSKNSEILGCHQFSSDETNEHFLPNCLDNTNDTLKPSMIIEQSMPIDCSIMKKDSIEETSEVTALSQPFLEEENVTSVCRESDSLSTSKENYPIIENNSIQEQPLDLNINCDKSVVDSLSLNKDSNEDPDNSKTLLENKVSSPIHVEKEVAEESEGKSIIEETTILFDEKSDHEEYPKNINLSNDLKNPEKENNIEKDEQLIVEKICTNSEVKPETTSSTTIECDEKQQLEEPKIVMESNLPKEELDCIIIEELTPTFQKYKASKSAENHAVEKLEQLVKSEVDVKRTFKKRIMKSRVSYAEFDSDSDELVKTRFKIPSLKINYSTIRAARRKSKLVKNKNVSKKPIRRRPSKRIQKLSNGRQKTVKLKKTHACSSLNDSEEDDDDKPLISTLNKALDHRSTRSSRISNDSDEDVPLKKITHRQPSQKTLPSHVSPMVKTKSKLKLAKQPSIIKATRRRASTLNYFALFMSDSDEEESEKPMKRRSTPDRLWSYKRHVDKKSVKHSEKRIVSLKNKSRHIRTKITQKLRNKKTRLAAKPKDRKVKMPVLNREDSDQTDLENIYECATISTPNDTDEEASSDRLRKRRQKVVKPMRIRCVSRRRTIPNDFITESSSCSSNSTIKTVQNIAADDATSSFVGFSKRGRLLRRKALENNLFRSTLFHESSSSSSPVMMKKHKRQFAAKSTSKLPKPEKHDTSNKITPLTFTEQEAIHNHNCVNFQIRLQRLTANEATLCRKPFIRLDKNFVRNYKDKLLEKDKLNSNSETETDDNPQ